MAGIRLGSRVTNEYDKVPVLKEFIFIWEDICANKKVTIPNKNKKRQNKFLKSYKYLIGATTDVYMKFHRLNR